MTYGGRCQHYTGVAHAYDIRRDCGDNTEIGCQLGIDGEPWTEIDIEDITAAMFHDLLALHVKDRDRLRKDLAGDAYGD